MTDLSLSIPDLTPYNPLSDPLNTLVTDPLNTLIGGQSSPVFQPIIQSLPSAQTALQRVTNKLAPQVSSFSPTVQNALTQLQQSRVAKGQQPLNAAQFMSAAQAAQTGQAVTQPPQSSPFSLGSLYHNAVSDLFDIGRSIPKLPLAAFNEAKLLPEVPGDIASALQSGSPLQDIAALARVPGIRFIPGAYTVGNLASGDFNTVASHPLMSLLDVLPAAGEAAGLTDVGKLAEESGMNPLRALATRSVDDEGALVPNRLGQFTEAVGQTRPGLIMREMFGRQARDVSSVGNLADTELRRTLNPASTYQSPNYDPDLIAINKAATQLASDATDTYNVTPDRHPAIMESMQTGDLSGLSDNELAFRQQAVDLGNRITQYKLNNDLLTERDGNYYLPEQGRILTAADNRLAARTADIIGDVIPRLQRAAGNDPRVQTLMDTLTQAVDPNSPTTIGDGLRLFNNLTKQKTRFGAAGKTGAEGATGETTLAGIANLRDTLRKAANAEERVGKLDRSIPPASVLPLVQKQVEQMLIDRYATADNVADISRAVTERNFAGIPGFDISDLRNFQDDARLCCQSVVDDSAAKGYDPPVFVHQTSPAQAAILDFPKLSDRVTTVSSLKERTLDYTPYVHDVTVGLRHESFELLRQQGEQAAAREILNSWGKRLYPEGDEPGLIGDYFSRARGLQAQYPTLDVAGIAKQLIDREYTPYNPEAYAPYATPKTLGIPSSADNPILVPKVVASTMEKLFGGEKIGPIAQIFSPVMRAFRTSVLPLSPRWHINNIVGNMMMLMGYTDPIKVWQHLSEARDIVNDLPKYESSGEIPRELLLRIGQRDINSDLTLRDQLAVRSGVTMGRIFGQIQDAKALGKVRDAFGNLVQKSYDINGHFDDMARAMSYLYGHGEALKSGLSEEASRQAGLELLRKAMITWDNVTPLERSIVRSIMPFYGFASHMIRYVLNFPGDHPIRASVLGQFARNELTDQGTGLPDTFLNAFFFGSPDKSGNQSSINFSTLNPFASVASNFTLAGFVAGLNPGLTTVLQSLGVDTSKGAPELYPQLAYDPDTGQLTASTTNPILGLIQNTIPQTRLLSALTGTSAEFKALLRANPAGASRLLESQIGLPTFFRSYNVPQEIAKSEVTRENQMQIDFNTALKTGDYTAASKWPGLIPLINQVHTLQAQGAFKQYTPQVAYPSNTDLLVNAGSQSIGF